MTFIKIALISLSSLLLAGALSKPTLAANKKKTIKPVASAPQVPTSPTQPLELKQLPVEEPVVPHVVNPCSNFTDSLHSILRNAGQLDQSHTYEALHKIERFPISPLKGNFNSDLPSTAAAEVAKGNLSGAMVLLRNELLLFPENMSIYSYLGQLNMETGDNAQAVQDFELALQRDTRDGTKWTELASAYLAIGKQQQAAQALFYGYIFQRSKDVLADYQSRRDQATFVQALQLINGYEEQLKTAYKLVILDVANSKGTGLQDTPVFQNRAGLHCGNPGFPKSAARAGIQGASRIDLLIDRNSTVIYVLLQKSSGSQELDRSALDWAAVCFAPNRRPYESLKNGRATVLEIVWKIE